MISLISNKKGEEILSIWMFLVWVIVGVGIVLGVLVFYSAKFDVRGLEADSLSDKVVDCLVDGGEIKAGFLDEIYKIKEDFDLYKECKLNGDMIKESYVLYVEVDDFGTCKGESGKLICTKIDEKTYGGESVQTECELNKNEQSKNFPICKEKRVFAFSGEKQILLKVIGGSNQVGSKV